jgi:hypothetical protein
VANLLLPIGTIMAERLLYLPMVGIIGAAAVLAPALLRRARLPASWRGGVLAGLAVVIVAALGLRSVARNQDWHDENSLWSSAAEACPHSYKVYQALAQAIYAKGMDDNGVHSQPATRAAIAVAEKGYGVITQPTLPVLDVPGLTLRMLAIYDMDLADSIAGQTGTDSQELAPQAQDYYQRAAGYLDLAVRADHAVNDTSRAYALSQGRRADEIPDVGTPDTYKLLGVLRLKMGQPEQAIAAFAYLRRLRPYDASAYELSALAAMRAGKDEEAAILLIECALLPGGASNRTYTTLVGLYGRLSPQTPALVMPNGRYAFNVANPMVRRHLNLACARLIKAYQDFGRPDFAAALYKQAIGDGLRCPPEALGPPPKVPRP